MSRLRLGLARAGALIATIFFWLWLALKLSITAIGASTVVDDYNQLVERLPAILQWLFSTPWWVPALLATTLTLFLLWLSWPRAGSGQHTSWRGVPKANPTGRFPTEDWDKPLEKRFRINYKNETVDVDGFEFIECTFDNVTFRYQGTKPFRLLKTKGNSKKVTTDNMIVGQTIILVAALQGELPPEYEVYKTGSK